MTRILMLSVWCVVCVGCIAGLTHPTPITKTVVLSHPSIIAYQRAGQALTRMGATLQRVEPQMGLLTGVVHGAVVLTVTVTPLPQGSSVEVTGSVLPNKLAVGRFTEVDDYLALLQEG